LKNKDNRVNAKRRVWSEYLTIRIVMLCLTGGQALILSEYVDLWAAGVPFSFILANVGYWSLMASSGASSRRSVAPSASMTVYAT
jgi:hypothetical protein